MIDKNNVNGNKNDSSISEDVAGIWQSAKQLPILLISFQQWMLWEGIGNLVLMVTPLPFLC